MSRFKFVQILTILNPYSAEPIDEVIDRTDTVGLHGFNL